jgi:hypothetical protein
MAVKFVRQTLKTSCIPISNDSGKGTITTITIRAAILFCDKCFSYGNGRMPFKVYSYNAYKNNLTFLFGENHVKIL